MKFFAQLSFKKARTPFCEVHMDIKLFYTDNGEAGGKCPMILLHGNGGNASSFFYVVDHYIKSRRVITLDTRGHGRSPKGDAPFTLKQFAEDLLCFMDEQGIDKADLIGYSDGGNIAMLFAIKYPERVNSMVLNGANMFPEGLMECDRRWIMGEYKRSKKALRRNPQNGKARESYDLMSLMVKEPHITPEELSALDIPTLVLVGSRDAIKPEHTRLIADSIKGSTLAVVDGGHNIVKSNSEGYIEALEDFYGKVWNKK